MRWTTFVESREERRLAALSQDAACAFASWSFAADPVLTGVAVEALDTTRLAPDPGLIAAAMLPPERLIPPAAEVDLAPPLHRRRLEESELPPCDASPRAWALEAVAFWGSELERRERRAWADAAWRTDTERDDATAVMWKHWFAGDAWSMRASWEAWFLPPAITVFGAVAEARRLPDAVRRRAVQDLRDALFYVMIGGTEGDPGWADVAARVVESGPPSPVAALAAGLEPAGWDRVAQCAARRGHWPVTAARVWPGTEATRRSGLRRSAPEKLDALLDLHVALRLIEVWSRDPRSDAWAIITQNRGRARARLRAALLATSRDTVLPALLALPALHARTEAAVRRFAWNWAWQELAGDFAFDAGRPVTLPCHAMPGIEPLGDAQAPALRTWLLLVVMKGRLNALRRWVQSGGTGDRDSTWGRLLSDHLPDALRDPGTGSYRRLRDALADGLDEYLRALEPALRIVASTPTDRRARLAIANRLGASWDAAIPFPRSGFPALIEQARVALSAPEDPCT